MTSEVRSFRPFRIVRCLRFFVFWSISCYQDDVRSPTTKPRYGVSQHERVKDSSSCADKDQTRSSAVALAGSLDIHNEKFTQLLTDITIPVNIYWFVHVLITSEMPFYAKDWRSPGESWIKTEDGWEKLKVLETNRRRLISEDSIFNRFVLLNSSSFWLAIYSLFRCAQLPSLRHVLFVTMAAQISVLPVLPMTPRPIVKFLVVMIASRPLCLTEAKKVKKKYVSCSLRVVLYARCKNIRTQVLLQTSSLYRDVVKQDSRAVGQFFDDVRRLYFD